MAKRTKNIALSAVPQTREDVVNQIARIGDLQGQLAVAKALAEPEKAMTIAGVTIKSAGEDFIIEPLELNKGAA